MGKRILGFLAVALLLISLLSVSTGQSSASVVPNEKNIGAILLDYGASLSTGQITKDSYYSPTMRGLLEERRAFYKEFFEVGLHSDLTGIESNFALESIIENARGNLYDVKAVETVILHGKYRCSSPEEHPLVKSGRWALARTDDPAVKQAIERYIQNVIDSVNESAQEGGFDIAFIGHHSLTINGQGKDLKIVQDSFTDASNDNPGGNDNVSWVNGAFVRSKPDLTQMPDYVIYHTPTEELGQSLLDDYSRIYDTEAAAGIQYTYSHANATTYINTWVKNTTITCATNVPQDQNNWNPAYTKYWCADCANYVSQALKAGGLPTSTTWQPYTYAWINVTGLANHLINTGMGVWAKYLSSLQTGDIAFIPGTHVVMVSALNPYRYSAHTSDRLKYTWASSINQYMDIR